MKESTIFDVLIALVKYGMPIAGTVAGIFLGKWLEEKNENKKLKREIYLQANRALKRYSDFYMTLGAFPNDNDRVNKLDHESTLLEEAKADLEMYSSDKIFGAFACVLKLAVDCGKEALSKSTNGKVLTDPKKDLSKYNEFLDAQDKWNRAARADLGIIAK